METLVTVDGMIRADAAGAVAITLGADADAAAVAEAAQQGGALRIVFPAMGDGRGFSLARRVRAMGFAGELRAAGPLIADQFAALAQVGFDAVEVTGAQVARLPRGARLAAPGGAYRARLLGG